MRRWRFAPLAIVLLHGAAISGQDGPRSPADWLDAMNHAFVERNYDGVFSYFDGDDLSALRVIHAVVDGVQRERLIHLNGTLREIVRTGNEVVCVVRPDDAILKLEESIPSGPFFQAFTRTFDDVSDNYRMTLEGEGRVADRDAVIMSVTPKDDDRYGYRLWLDRDKSLLLRSELIDGKGTRLEIFQFASVAIDQPIDPSLLAARAQSGVGMSRVALQVARRDDPSPPTAWRVAWLPDGFAVAARDVYRTPASDNSVNTLMYSDGLAAFSVFVEEMPKNGAARMVSRQGATVAVTRVAHGPAGSTPYLITVVGEVPVATAQKVAESVRYNASGQ